MTKLMKARMSFRIKQCQKLSTVLFLILQTKLYIAKHYVNTVIECIIKTAIKKIQDLLISF